MKAFAGASVVAVFLAGCTSTGDPQTGGDVVVSPPGASDQRPRSRPDRGASGGGLNDGGVTVAEATDVSEAEVKAATAPAAGSEQELGQTIATLGLLEREGFWLATPLVKSERAGRVVYLETGAAANVTLVPNGTTDGSGSQLSLATMQALGIPLTELARIQVFSK